MQNLFDPKKVNQDLVNEQTDSLMAINTGLADTAQLRQTIRENKVVQNMLEEETTNSTADGNSTTDSSQEKDKDKADSAGEATEGEDGALKNNVDDGPAFEKE